MLRRQFFKQTGLSLATLFGVSKFKTKVGDGIPIPLIENLEPRPWYDDPTQCDIIYHYSNGTETRTHHRFLNEKMPKNIKTPKGIFKLQSIQMIKKDDCSYFIA